MSLSDLLALPDLRLLADAIRRRDFGKVVQLKKKLKRKLMLVDLTTKTGSKAK